MTTPIAPWNYFPYRGQLEFHRSGQAGRVQNDGDVRQIDGIAVDVPDFSSKLVIPTSFAPGPGIQTVKREGPPNLLAPSTLAASIQLQSLPQLSQAERDAAKTKDASAYATAIGEVTEMYFTPAGTEPQSVEDLGFVPGEVLHGGRKAEYVASEVARIHRMADIKTKPSAEYDADVKLAYDPLAQEYVMLRPGQFGYGRVTSAPGGVRPDAARCLQDGLTTTVSPFPTVRCRSASSR